MNVITVVGRLTNEPTTDTIGGQNCAKFGVASRNTKKDANSGEYGTNFYNCTAWGKLSETASKYLHKGYSVALNGDLVLRDYTTNDGSKRTSADITIRNMDLIEKKRDDQAPATTAPVAKKPAFTPVETDDLPF